MNQYTKIVYGSVFLVTAGVGVCLQKVQAHPLDVAYFDFSTTPTSTWLTVAVHPYQAFELVRAGGKIPFDLKRLASRQELVAAYISGHVALTQNTKSGENCSWEPDVAHVPSTELDAVADGVTIAAPVICPQTIQKLHLESDIFFEGFPQQSNIVRLEYPQGFAEKGSIDIKTHQFELEIPAYASNSIAIPQSLDSRITPARRPDAQYADIAKRLLDPGLNLTGFILLLGSATLIGALHALGPGHGKALMAAVLVGEQATIKRVLALGTVMTVTHVADVFLLAIFAGFIAAFLPPTNLIKWLEVFSAVGLVFFGAFRIFDAWKHYKRSQQNPNQATADEAHLRAHQLGLPKPGESFSRALWLGFVGSLAPCPTAWAIFMGTLSIGRTGAGLALLIAFTIGLHLTILFIGFLLVLSKQFAARRTSIRFIYTLPIISSVAITLLGVYLLLRNLAIIR